MLRFPTSARTCERVLMPSVSGPFNHAASTPKTNAPARTSPMRVRCDIRRMVPAMLAGLDDALEATRRGGLERVTTREGKTGRGGLAEPDRGHDGVRLGVDAELRQDVLRVGSQGV